MSLLAKAWRFLLVAGCGLFLAGCLETGNSPADEQNEANHARGRTLVASGDYPGAVEAFEKALEVNPKNASAHFELAILFEQHLKDYVSAIYHGMRFCKLRPNSEEAKLIRQRMDSCLVELVKDVPVGPTTPLLQREIERVKKENQALRQQLALLSEQLARATNRPPETARETPAPSFATSREPEPRASANASPSSRRPAVASPPSRSRAATASPSRARPAPSASSSGRKQTPAADSTARKPSPATGRRPSSHTVRSGETLASIAQKYGVSLSVLQKANGYGAGGRPKAGQVLRIPGPNER